MSVENFTQLVSKVTDQIGSKPVDKNLQSFLNETFPPNSQVFKDIRNACEKGISEGWMCQYENGGVKYGRVVKPTPVLNNCSIDVVEMANAKGMHHGHSEGEIDMIMPIDANAKFDGHPAGWLVYEPGSAHSPTVTDGKAWILYLLPNGKIEFTK
jgi:hypothetical protein